MICQTVAVVEAMKVINDIVAVSQPFILVLDDYHLITALPVHQQLGFLLDRQPPQMHLAIATREDPPLPLSRLRARGQVTDVRQADLQFTPEETAEFLRRVAQAEFSSDDVSVLQRRTEGWVAGLQLLALSIRGSEDVRRLVDSFTYFSARANHALDLGHYFGAPCVVAKKLFGRWILVPTRWNLFLTERWLRPRYEEPLPEVGAYLFFVAVKD